MGEMSDELALIVSGVDVNKAPPTEADELEVLGEMYTETDGVFVDG